MTALESGRATRYDCAVLATAGAGGRSPSTARRVAPDQAFFYARSIHLNGGLRGEAEKPAGVLSGRSANPTNARHPSFRSECGGLQSQLGVPL